MEKNPHLRNQGLMDLNNPQTYQDIHRFLIQYNLFGKHINQAQENMYKTIHVISQKFLVKGKYMPQKTAEKKEEFKPEIVNSTKF